MTGWTDEARKAAAAARAARGKRTNEFGNPLSKEARAAQGQLSGMTKAFSAFAGVMNHSGDSNAAHQAAVNAVGKPFRLQSYTHEIVDPKGEVVGRMKIGKNSGFAVDSRGTGSISRSGGPSIHNAVSMADYRARDKGSFPSEHIGTELHYLTGNDFAGHTIRRKK